MGKQIYLKEELYKSYERKVYTEKHSQAAFLLGGIGTGNVSIGSRGEFRDWEIYNSPGKGNTLDYTFFSIWTKEENSKINLKVLESEIQPPFIGSTGYSAEKFAGLPRFRKSEMYSEYPFVNVKLIDEEMPVEVVMESFTPFIPLSPDDSGIPGAVIRYKVKNKTNHKVDVTIAGSVGNAIGFINNSVWGPAEVVGERYNEKKIEQNLTGISFGCSDINLDSIKFGNMALMTTDQNITVKPTWYEGQWWDGIQEFWNDFREDGRLNEKATTIGQKSSLGSGNKVKVGSLGVSKELKPNEEKTFEFILTWYFPNRADCWSSDVYHYDFENGKTVRNYYATNFSDAWDVGKYLVNNLEKLEDNSRLFTEAIYTSTYPSDVIEAIANNITVIRSNTCFRVEGGNFFAWEGCHDLFGSCAGTCTHVWNYAQTLAFLFPTLEQKARIIEFNHETDSEGKMAFRTVSLFSQEQEFKGHAAADGQMGTIIRLYREWKLSGDDDFLRNVWENATKALDYAFKYWDEDGDYVLESQQHNTYDIEFYGPNSLTSSMFLAALKAASEMAQYLGDDEHHKKYAEAFKKGSTNMDELLWGNDYYIQKIDDVNEYKYQYGKGCLSDQLLGQTLAHVVGLGYILPKDHVSKAAKSIFDNNFKQTMKDHINLQRTYALNDEKGLLLCTWPEGGRPKIPFVYSDEVWTGIEYHVATHLIYEGYIEEALTIVKAVRERYDGIKRSPWSEVECGYHYARSLASWGLLIGLSGFEFDMTKDYMSFDPKINQSDFKTFWSTGKSWGVYTQKIDDKTGKVDKNVEELYKL